MKNTMDDTNRLDIVEIKTFVLDISIEAIPTEMKKKK